MVHKNVHKETIPDNNIMGIKNTILKPKLCGA